MGLVRNEGVVGSNPIASTHLVSQDIVMTCLEAASVSELSALLSEQILDQES